MLNFWVAHQHVSPNAPGIPFETFPQIRQRVIKQQWQAINVHTSTAYDLQNHFFGHKIWVQLDGKHLKYWKSFKIGEPWMTT